MWAAAAGLLALAVWTPFALALVSPVVLGDEWGFYLDGVAFDRLPRLWAGNTMQAPVGVFVFPWLIHAFTGLAPHPATLVKVANAAAVAAAATVLSLHLVRREDRKSGFPLALALALYPTGTFAAYVMPEAVYALLFALALAALWSAERARARRGEFVGWALAGAAAGLMTAVKPHGLFVAAAIGVTGPLWSLWTGRTPLARALGWSAAAAVGFLAAYGLAGWATLPPGVAFTLDPFGSAYRAQLGGAVGGGARRLAAGLELTGVYGAAILTLFAPALVQVVEALWRARRGTSAGAGGARPITLFLPLLIAGLAVAVAFVVAIEPERTHLRYLDFALPALLVEAWRSGRPGGAWRRAAAGVWVLSALVYVLALAHLRPLPVDAPELFFAYASGEFGPFGLGHGARWILLALVGAGAAALAFTRAPWPAVQAAVLAPLMLVAVFNIARTTHGWARDSDTPRALGELAFRRCGPADGDVVVLATPESQAWVFQTTWPLRRATPVVLADAGQVLTLLRASPAGRCVLSSADVHEPRLERLSPSAPLVLYRVRSQP